MLKLLVQNMIINMLVILLIFLHLVYGNKTITTGEGGMVVTKNKKLDERIKLLKGQGLNKKINMIITILL